jgi:hypothetical protein
MWFVKLAYFPAYVLICRDHQIDSFEQLRVRRVRVSCQPLVAEIVFQIQASSWS